MASCRRRSKNNVCACCLKCSIRLGAARHDGIRADMKKEVAALRLCAAPIHWPEAAGIKCGALAVAGRLRLPSCIAFLMKTTGS